jgi:hypothetical protein
LPVKQELESKRVMPCTSGVIGLARKKLGAYLLLIFFSKKTCKPFWDSYGTAGSPTNHNILLNYSDLNSTIRTVFMINFIKCIQ